MYCKRSFCPLRRNIDASPMENLRVICAGGPVNAALDVIRSRQAAATVALTEETPHVLQPDTAASTDPGARYCRLKRVRGDFRFALH